MRLLNFTAVAVLLVSLLAAPAAAQSTLENIKRTGVLNLGYRADAPPFSFAGDDRKPQGYSVDLCALVAREAAQQLNLPGLKVNWVPVTAANRFDAVKRGQIDLECGNTTQTLSRRADFDFSVMTFVDGAGLLYRSGEKPASAQEMQGQRFAVVSGTTTERALERIIGASRMGATLLKVRDHEAALAALNERKASAYAADRTVLITTALTRGHQVYDIADVQFTYEPYGLMMRRDADFRLLVDRALSQAYSSPEIEVILSRWFPPAPGLVATMRALIQLNALPE